MEIKYLGHSSFFIKTRNAKVVTDPYDPAKVGFKFPKTEADIVTVSHSHDDHYHMAFIDGNPLVIDWPGQFERKGTRITGFKSYHDNKKGEERGDNVIYKIEVDLVVLHCGDLGAIPDDSLLDEIGEIDILMVPVGGVYTIDAAQALDLVKKVEPSIVIPMHYKTPQINQEAFGQLGTVDDFLKKLGIENVVPVPKLIIKKEELGEEMKVVVMEL